MSTDSTQYTNRLIEQTSPYLRQHAHNPVDWWPWCPQALDKAREEDKLILLSIGYSACHWCHVMAHESFEDAQTAQVMNELYVNIKVDREERPDLDKIYQTAHQLLNQRGGGWPLTVVLTPQDRVPFFAGTYFPGEPKHGMPAFKDILQRVDAFYREHREDVEKQNASMVSALKEISLTESSSADVLDSRPLDQARQQLEENFDTRHAGFGQAPKFPHPGNLDRLLRHWAATEQHGAPDQRALDMARMTLRAMAGGGIYDQIGGGFYRYSVDDYWMIPHFEKMLYDNGPLLSLNAEAYAITGEALFRRVTLETGEWVMREMQSPQGGYYATLDADSEGEEGKFYVWTPQEVQTLLSDEQFRLFAPIYGLDRGATFEGHWHLHMFRDPDEVGRSLGLEAEAIDELLLQARQRLFAQRERRVRPGRDEKILTAWNGLMIKGMADAGRRLQRGDFVLSAQKAVDFIHESLFEQGRLLATYKDGKARLNAYLDDYVFMADGLLALLQAQWRDKDLAFALQLIEAVLTHFEDRDQGGFYFTSADHEELIQRPKTLMDESIPAGNGVAACVLGRLGHLVGETRYLEAAQRALQAAWSSMSRIPYVHASLLNALEDYLYPPQTVVLRGPQAALDGWHRPCAEPYAPHRMCFAIPNDAAGLPGLLGERRPTPQGVIAYVCSGMQCQAPTTEHDAFLEQLSRH